MNETGHIETVPARDLRVGDVFSTDSGRVTHAQVFGATRMRDAGSVYVETICHGIVKRALVAPDFPCHLWRKDR